MAHSTVSSTITVTVCCVLYPTAGTALVGVITTNSSITQCAAGADQMFTDVMSTHNSTSTHCYTVPYKHNKTILH
jgi:hypothetical protein